MSSLDELIEEIVAFRDERDWAQFHTPHQLAAALSIEAAELQECFLWKEAGEIDAALQGGTLRDRAVREAADVLIFALLFCESIQVDPAQAILDKLEKNASKYPVESAKGRSTKYTELPDAEGTVEGGDERKDSELEDWSPTTVGAACKVILHYSNVQDRHFVESGVIRGVDEQNNHVLVQLQGEDDTREFQATMLRPPTWSPKSKRNRKRDPRNEPKKKGPSHPESNSGALRSRTSRLQEEAEEGRGPFPGGAPGTGKGN